MPTYSQASLSDVFAAGAVRSTQFAASLVAELARRVPDQQQVQSWYARLINLRMGLQEAALETDPAKRDKILGYLQETYGLLDAALDPLLHPLVPPLAASGNVLVPIILNVNGFDVVVNEFFVGLGFALAPVANPVYNTPLINNNTVSAVTYRGLPSTVFAFDGPVLPGTGTAPFLRLFVGGVQVGRVDFPDSLLGQGFSLLYNGMTYYNQFQNISSGELDLA